jgi:uncharacterized protein YgfB (UPF0149 family)
MMAAAHPPWWNDFDRQAVLAAIEEAAGTPLAATDPLPDMLIAQAQALGITPIDLRLWIYDEPKREDWSASALAKWVRWYRMGAAAAELPQ